jgi:hypothetical protein
VGDRTHPDAVEVIATYMDWAERNERLLSQFVRLLQSLNGGVPEDVLRREPVGVA